MLLPFGGLEEASGGASLFAGSWGSCDCIWGPRLLGASAACPSLSHLGKHKCHGHGVRWWPSPCSGAAGDGTTGGFHLGTECSPLWGPGCSRQGPGALAQTPLSKGWAKPELRRGHRAGHGFWEVPVSVSLPTSQRRVCSRLGQTWGEEPAPAGRAHAAAGSPFAAEEWGETAETALALVSPPPAHCPICQGPRCPL